jgi:hypothetical protein
MMADDGKPTDIRGSDEADGLPWRSQETDSRAPPPPSRRSSTDELARVRGPLSDIESSTLGNVRFCPHVNNVQKTMGQFPALKHFHSIVHIRA